MTKEITIHRDNRVSLKGTHIGWVAPDPNDKRRNPRWVWEHMNGKRGTVRSRAGAAEGLVSYELNRWNSDNG